MQRLLMCLGLAASLAAADEKTGALTQFSSALERLAATVAPAVVQVQVSGWCAPASADGGEGATLASCRVIGSGVIVDPSGYIITNEHVVRNARNIRVMLTPKPNHSAEMPAASGQKQALDAVVVDSNRDPLGRRQVLDAVVVGANRETDIALLKIDAAGLPTIPLNQTGSGPHQGQVVLAVGSPEGLDNTMTLGIVSAVGRQPQPDFPMLYIQTDAAINPGNSGGPLLDVAGELIGINTFMFGENGRNQGLGFAVPAGVVRYVYEQLRRHGFVQQSLVGVRVQTVTPALAQGLGLSRGYGLMISDVLPDSPADIAGLRPRDMITAVDGAEVFALPYYAAMMYLHDPAVPVDVTILRGERTLQFHVPAVAVDDRDYSEASVDSNEGLVSDLGIFGKSLNSTLAIQNGLRSRAGIYVVATTAKSEGSSPGLATGDVIVSLNGVPIHDMQELRSALDDAAAGTPAVVQIERSGRFVYIEGEMDRQPSNPSTARGGKRDSTELSRERR